MSEDCESRLVILPSYNSGDLLCPTAAAARDQWPQVWVVIDGSTDDSANQARDYARSQPGVEVIVREQNGGKGTAVLEMMKRAADRGFTHALVMDADGQHPADRIPEFMRISQAHPEAMVLGVPEFGPDAPSERVHGRKVGNTLAQLETLWGGVEDSLFGFRLYPIGPSLRVMDETRHGRRFDFDTELAVRLFWAGVRPISRSVPVHYPPREGGGVTHFRYLRDNLLLAKTHARLTLQLVPRLWRVWRLRNRWKSQNLKFSLPPA